LVPEMRSTGEIIGIDKDNGITFLKVHNSSSNKIFLIKEVFF
jgi:hypothetical protein